MPHAPSSSSKPRIQWIDALRGLTMFLVVFQHVHSFSYGVPTPISLFFITFRMPLFFFISGFIAYRMARITTPGQYRDSLLKKSRVQIIPMAVFGILYTLIGAPVLAGDLETYLAQEALSGSVNPLSRIAHLYLSPWKHGYWFTWALLGMFIIYFTVTYALHRLSRRWTNLALIGLALGMFCFVPIYTYQDLISTHPLSNFLSLRHVAHYFQYFVFGNIFAHYQQSLLQWIRRPLVVVLSLLFTFGIFIALQYNSQLWLPAGIGYKGVRIAITQLQKYSALILLLMLFSRHESTFSQQKSFGRVLQFVGRRTLDIYLLHYFFLPNLKSYATLITSNTVVAALVATLIAALVIALALGVSALLRCSPFLARNLFGAKR